MIAQECPPGLRWRHSVPDHVLGDRRLGDLEPKLQQFTMDARSAPQWVLLAHLSDEFAQLKANSRPPWLSTRFPTPIGSKPCSMPPQNRVRLNDAGQNQQAWPEPRHPYQQRPVTPTQSQMVRCAPQCNIELMPKKEVLDFKPARRLEQVGDKCPKQMEDGKHRVR